jgi:hypothetical protein
MAEQKVEASEVFMDTMLSKLEQLDGTVLAHVQKLEVVERRINEGPDVSKEMGEVKKWIQGLRNSIQSQQFPEKAIRDLSFRLDAVMEKLAEPVRHHHHISKFAWMTITLFLFACLSTIGWGVSNARLKVYMGNDIKYRKLELLDDMATLQYLWRLDSIYTASPDSLQTYVADQERLKRQRLELIDHMHVLDSQIDTSTEKLHPLKGK